MGKNSHSGFCKQTGLDHTNQHYQYKSGISMGIKRNKIIYHVNTEMGLIMKIKDFILGLIKRE